jgi:hypothetical protein
VQYTATTNQTVFTVPFEFFANSDLKVYNGSTLLTFASSPANASQYNVSGAGVTGGGSITLGSPGATLGNIITIVRGVPIERTSDFPLSGPFNIEALNTTLDKMTVMLQDVDTKFEQRVPRLAENDTPNTLAVIPSISQRKSKLFYWDENGQPSAIDAFGIASVGNPVNARDYGAVNDGVTDAFAAFTAAAAAAVANNVPMLIPAGSYATSSALSFAAMDIICDGTVTITYTGTAHINRVLSMSLAGLPASISGKLVVNGSNKANIAVFVINDNATRVSLSLGDVEGRSCRMISGSAFNAGSAGVIVRGNFTTVLFDRLWAKDIGRAAGTGSPSNFGTNGVIIDRDSSARAALIVSGPICGAENITCDDTPGSPGAVDVDGVAIFQNDETGAACKISLVSSVDAEGRGFKAQTYRATNINQISIVRSVSSTTGGNADVNMQYCEGAVDKCDIVYSGNADTVHGQGTTCVTYFTDLNRTDGFGVAPIRNLTVRDNCTSGTATIDAITCIAYNAVNSTNKFGSIENVLLLNRTAKSLINIINNGASGYGRFLLKIDGFVGGLTAGLIGCLNAPTNLLAGVSRVWNTGTAVPAVYRTDAAALGNNFGKIIDNGGNIGILRYRGTGGLPGLVDDGVNGFTSLSVAAGLSPLISGDFAQNVTTQTDKFGVVPGNGLLIMGTPDYGAPGIYTTSGNTITTVQSAVGVAVGSGGVDPGGIDFNVWKTDSGTRLSIKNAGATTRPFFVLVIG